MRRWFWQFAFWGIFFFILWGMESPAAEDGWEELAGSWCYDLGDGNFAVNEWMKIEEQLFYFDARGMMVKGWHVVDGVKYYFQKTGEWLPGWAHHTDTNRWYYYDDDKSQHKGWLWDQGAWYWFGENGEMVFGGNRTIDGAVYYFFNDGQLASDQYIGLRYMDGNGQNDASHDVKLVGQGQVNGHDRDMISDALYLFPRKWIARFVKNDWEFMFYTSKSYFSAPDTEYGVYYVHYNLDSTYKKLKFCKTDSLVRAFGEYIGYAAGCYREGNQDMIELRMEQINVSNLTQIPDFFDGDDAFYFGVLCELFLDTERRAELMEVSPQTCEIMERILYH